MASLFDRNPHLHQITTTQVETIMELDEAIGEIAKFLPMGANVSERSLNSAACDVAMGKISPSDAANRLTSKKIIIKRN
jgi:hypothetical protein